MIKRVAHKLKKKTQKDKRKDIIYTKINKKDKFDAINNIKNVFYCIIYYDKLYLQTIKVQNAINNS